MRVATLFSVIVLMLDSPLAFAQSLETFKLNPLVKKERVNIPIDYKCYSEKDNQDLNNVLDEGVKAVFNLKLCREWRDRYRIELEKLEKNPTMTPLPIVYREKKGTKKKIILGSGLGLIVGLILGASF